MIAAVRIRIRASASVRCDGDVQGTRRHWGNRLIGLIADIGPALPGELTPAFPTIPTYGSAFMGQV